MTKAELIRKIARRAGVPDSEAKVFFEIFLKKSSELLAPGQAVLLKGFGHFQFKKGKIRQERSEEGKPGRETIFVDLMAYYPARQLEKDISENLVFNIPAIQFENFNPIDSYFSLSFGRPVIPIQGVKPNEVFIPLTGLELRKLVEAKVDKLVKELEIIKDYTKGSEVLVIEPGSYKSHQLEFNWGEVPSQNISGSLNGRTEKDETLPGSEISWDFGPDISKQIEEDSILDVDKQDEYTGSGEKKDPEEVSWDFGISSGAGEVRSVSGDFVIAGTPEPELEPEPDEDDRDVTKEKFERVIPEEDDESFERVKPISANLLDADNEDEVTTDEGLSWDSVQEKPDYENFEPETKLTLDEEEEIPELKETDRTVQFSEDLEKFSSGDTVVEKSGPEVDETPEPAEETSDEKIEEKSNYSASSVMEKRKEREAYYSRRGTSPIFLVALIVIIAVSVTLYFYLRGTFSAKKTDIKELSASVNTEIIKRDFEIPVSYPYERKLSGTNSTAGSNTPKIKSGAVKKLPGNTVTTKLQPPVKSESRAGNNKSTLIKKSKTKVDVNDPSTFTFENLPPPDESGNPKDQVSPGNGGFTVQVSSWKSRPIAFQQVAKFKAKGYDAYIEKADIPGKGTWYRVKVRNFKSQKEAEDFLSRNH